VGWIFGAVWALFARIEDIMKPESKKAISNWLLRIDTHNRSDGFPDAFIKLFDSVFGERHFTLRCFLLSSIASFTGVFIMLAVYFWIRPEGVELLIGNYFEDDLVFIFIFIPFGTITFNIFTDYISLLETRLLLRWMRKTKSLLCRIFIIVFDFIITTALFIVIGGLLVALITDNTFFDFIRIDFIRTLVRGFFLAPSEEGFTIGIWLYTTYFTSVWLWLFLAASGRARMVQISLSGVRFFQKHFDLENYPLRSLGYMVSSFITLVYLVAFFAMTLS
jgi:hypothetical protein